MSLCSSINTCKRLRYLSSIRDCERGIITKAAEGLAPMSGPEVQVLRAALTVGIQGPGAVSGFDGVVTRVRGLKTRVMHGVSVVRLLLLIP